MTHYCRWCRPADTKRGRHDPRCPEVCRNKEAGRAAWMRGKADAEMHQHNSGESYNGQYELGHELEHQMVMFWDKYGKEIDELEKRYLENGTRGDIII